VRPSACLLNVALDDELDSESRGAGCGDPESHLSHEEDQLELDAVRPELNGRQLPQLHSLNGNEPLGSSDDHEETDCALLDDAREDAPVEDHGSDLDYDDRAPVEKASVARQKRRRFTSSRLAQYDIEVSVGR